jgi:hypothetical protein
VYSVLLSKRVQKQIDRMPRPIARKLAILIEQLRESGPLQPEWPNYGKLGPDRYHCHLAYRWVACWYWAKGALRIEVHYVGSREDAPY